MLFDHIHGHLNDLGNQRHTIARALIRARILSYGPSWINVLIHWEF